MYDTQYQMMPLIRPRETGMCSRLLVVIIVLVGLLGLAYYGAIRRRGRLWRRARPWGRPARVNRAAALGLLVSLAVPTAAHAARHRRRPHATASAQGPAEATPAAAARPPVLAAALPDPEADVSSVAEPSLTRTDPSVRRSAAYRSRVARSFRVNSESTLNS